jgi:hypothetical protein
MMTDRPDMAAGDDGLFRGRTRPSRIPPLGPQVAQRMVALTLTDLSGDVTHRTSAAVAKAIGISVSSRCPTIHGSPPGCAASSAYMLIRGRTRARVRFLNAIQVEFTAGNF